MPAPCNPAHGLLLGVRSSLDPLRSLPAATHSHRLRAARARLERLESPRRHPLVPRGARLQGGASRLPGVDGGHGRELEEGATREGSETLGAARASETSGSQGKTRSFIARQEQPRLHRGARPGTGLSVSTEDGARPPLRVAGGGGGSSSKAPRTRDSATKCCGYVTHSHSVSI